jgi:hypothetical protein
VGAVIRCLQRRSIVSLADTKALLRARVLKAFGLAFIAGAGVFWFLGPLWLCQVLVACGLVPTLVVTPRRKKLQAATDSRYVWRGSIRGILLVFIVVDLALFVSMAGYTAWLLGVLGAVLIVVAVRFGFWLRRGSALH